MEKLIELLNEFGDINRNKEMIRHQDTYVISKQFGFIKWLVENDKIDYGYLIPFTTFWQLRGDGFSIEDCLIMWLSISVNPISILIQKLK